MRAFRLPSLSKRKIVAYAMSAAIFAAAVWVSVRLSFPPDPLAARGHLPARGSSPVQVETQRDTLTISRDRDVRRFRFRETEDGLVAEELPEED